MRRRICAVVAGLLLAGMASVPAHAATDVDCNEQALRDAITGSNGSMTGDTLNLTPYCVYTLTNDNGQLPEVTAPLVIHGRHATIRREPGAANFYRVFRVGAVPLALDTLSVMNGSAVDNGGAVYLSASGASLTATDVDFLGNAGDFGGAIATEDGATVSLTRGTVGDNRAVTNGGGLYAVGTTAVTLDSVKVTGNRANVYAAGLYISTNAPAIINNSTISRNTARFAAGGIYYTGIVSLAVTGSTIANNKVTDSLESGAGILYNASAGTGTITDSTISGNTVTGFTTDDTASNGGGGITMETGPLTLDNTRVTGNQVIGASAHGGGIAVNAIFGTPPPTLTLQNNTRVTGNLASGRYSQGGGLYANALAAPVSVSVSGSHIDGNKVTGTGSVSGGVYNIGGTFSFGSASSVNNNIAPNAPAPGGVYTDTAITTVDGATTFTGNTPTNCLLSPVAVTNCVN
ncbi:hypothetical protein [Streptomyces sp. NPDC086787]|uniref:hypothetical protein n=1 Tax=Streptomyces sp. NPDC086787 TaxID=3365759 RepID=UPI00381100A4